MTVEEAMLILEGELRQLDARRERIAKALELLRDDEQQPQRTKKRPRAKAPTNGAATAPSPETNGAHEPKRRRLSEEEIEKFKRLWNEGKSADEISDALGLSGRGAVYAKAISLGLPSRRTKTTR